MLFSAKHSSTIDLLQERNMDVYHGYTDHLAIDVSPSYFAQAWALFDPEGGHLNLPKVGWSSQ